MVLLLSISVWMLFTVFMMVLASSNRAAISEKFSLANKLYTQGKYQEAYTIYKDLADTNPNNADYRCNLGSLLVDVGRSDEGVLYYREALEIREDHPVALFNLAMILQDSKDQALIDESRVLYRKLVEVEPENAEAWSNLGSLEHQEGHLGIAVSCYRKALSLYSNENVYTAEDSVSVRASLHEYLGRAQLRMSAILANHQQQQKQQQQQQQQQHTPTMETSTSSSSSDSGIHQQNGEAVSTDDDPTQQRISLYRNEGLHQLKVSLSLNPSNDVVIHLLRSEGAWGADEGEIPDEAPAEYVKRLFDDYSSTFENSLQSLGYSVPSLLAAAVLNPGIHTTEAEVNPGIHKNEEEVEPGISNCNEEQCVVDAVGGSGSSSGSSSTSSKNDSSPNSDDTNHNHHYYGLTVDLGCGTGLLGPLIRGHTDVLVGVDLSPGMLAKAEELREGVYDHLYAGDMTALVNELAKLRHRLLAGNDVDEDPTKARRKFVGSVIKDVDQVLDEGFTAAFRGIDAVKSGRPVLISAADVFVYVGDLHPIFTAVSHLAVSGDVFAFTVESIEEEEEGGAEKKVTTEKTNTTLTEVEVSAEVRTDIQNTEVRTDTLPKGWVLRSTGRFAHRRSYIQSLAKAYPNMQIVGIQNIVPRSELGKDIRGMLVLIKII